VNENDWASLGLIGSTGFLILVVAIFSDRLRSWDLEIHSLCYLNLAGLLLATIGGFSTLVAIFFPFIRGYNRVSIYLAFFGLFTISLLIDKFIKRYAQSYRKIFYIILYMLLGAGILDQTSPAFTPPHEEKKILHAEQAGFICKIESSLPSKAMIFQLPYFPFPENPPIHKIRDYDHFGGGYLFSKELRWSYGAIKGREADYWQKTVAAKAVEEFLETISLVGFQGIYIDRYGYEDNAITLEKTLSKLLGSSPMASPNQRYSFFSLMEYSQELTKKYPAREWERKREMANYPLYLSWGGGFSGFEGTQENNWHWCSHEGVLFFHNPSPYPRKVELEMVLATGYEEYSEIKILGDLLSENIKVNFQGIPLKRTVAVPPGRHSVYFKTNAKKINAAGDLRTLVFPDQ
jgi:phosphoglycerol transferase